jgi:HEAT repeat protein
MSYTADGPRTNQPERESAPTQDEIASAGDAMLAMVRAAKGMRIYLPNNPVLIKFVDELNSKMAEHIARFGDLQLDVEPFALRYKGAELYRNEDPKDSLAFRIHTDGIRVLLFSEGLELRELKAFLGVVAFEQPSHQDDDIVTQLWERELPHVSYLLEEDLLGTPAAEEGGGAESQQESITRFRSSHVELRRLPPRMVPKHLLMLSREDAGWLRKARQSEVYRNPLDDVFNIVFAILSGVKEPELFTDFLRITASLVENMFLIGDIGNVLMLVRFLDRLRDRDGLAREQRQQVREIMDGILTERSVQMLQEAIDAGEAVGYDEVRELLKTLGLPALGGICELLGRVEKLKMRKLIVEVLVELGKDRPEVFEPFLSDPRWYLVRNVVLVLSLLGTPRSLQMIVGLVSHKEQRIRREVLGFLERSSDPKAKNYLLKYLRDDASALRIKALQSLARERLPFALKPILALTAAEDFKVRELAEKKAVYEAIGELGSDEELLLFRDMLLKKRWFQKGATREAVVCAVAGLSKMGTPQARELLEQARTFRNPELREIVEQALAVFAAGQQEPGEADDPDRRKEA